MAKLALQGNDAGTGTFTLQAPATNLNRNLVLPDVDGTLSTMEQVKLPIGSFMWFTGTVAPEAFIVADGQLRSRAAFPDLWAFAQASGNISVDDASWTFGQYSPGDGATTFRVPKVDDRFIRGKSATRAIGLVEEDAFQGHKFNISYRGLTTSNTGAGTWMIANASSSTLSTGDPISDGINGTPRTADETRPKALTMLPCIKAYDVISDPNVLNAVAVVNEISRLESEKLRKDENINLGVSVAASGTAVDFVGIPAGVKRITVMFDGVSTNGTSIPLIRIGHGTTDNSGYSSITCGILSNQPDITRGGRSTDGFRLILNSHAATHEIDGVLRLDKIGDNTWVVTGNLKLNDYACSSIGSKFLLAELNILRFTTANGTDQFDAGTINISWEF